MPRIAFGWNRVCLRGIVPPAAKTRQDTGPGCPLVSHGSDRYNRRHMHDSTPSVRIQPDNWLEPIALEPWFARDQPLTVDLGCGKGRFLLAYAANHPDQNLLGIDRIAVERQDGD